MAFVAGIQETLAAVPVPNVSDLEGRSCLVIAELSQSGIEALRARSPLHESCCTVSSPPVAIDRKHIS